MGAFSCIVFPAFAALVVALIVISVVRARRRREAMQRLADEIGFLFYPADPWDLPGRYAHFDLFSSGRARRASNILHGEVDGRAVMVFDYRYTTGSGKSQSTHHYQVGVFELPILAARVRMRRESFLDRVASWVGYDDIDFESDEFSRRYHVKSDDRRFAYDFFHARLIEYLLGCGEAPNLATNGATMVLYDGGSGRPEGFRRLILVGRKIVESIPDYVVKARAVERPPGG